MSITLINKSGIWFHYKGDELCWLWPWMREGKGKYVSVGYSGTGQFGDARFNSLEEYDQFEEQIPREEL